MAARSSMTVTSLTSILASWGNAIRNHIVPATTSDDVSTEGQMAVNTSTDRVVVHNGSAAVEVTRYGVGSSFTADAAQSFPVASTNGDVGYQRFGRWIVGHIKMTFTGNGSTGVAIGVQTDLPAPSATVQCGTFTYITGGGTVYQGTAFLTSTQIAVFYAHNQTTGGLGASPSFAITSADVLFITFGYYAGS